ncbi:MAG: class I SAM-dependent methyltransferase [Candidatus Melainabacteria bacterium]|nr:class I SAM-dependent methyltransferase [Candidatus Melainabacteria bacterium]
MNNEVYQKNIEFWQRAWNMVKTPYTHMPDLPYLASIPGGLHKAGARRVLDLGCGSGWLAIFLSHAGFFVTGIDLSSHAIELGRSWADKEGLEIEFDCGDVTNLPYPPGSFDAVVANSIFEHLTHSLASATLSQLKTILVPGGTFFGCFDKVGGGPGQYYELPDKTHVYTDKGRAGMLLRCFSDNELRSLFAGWTIQSLQTIETGSRLLWANN